MDLSHRIFLPSDHVSFICNMIPDEVSETSRVLLNLTNRLLRMFVVDNEICVSRLYMR